MVEPFRKDFFDQTVMDVNTSHVTSLSKISTPSEPSKNSQYTTPEDGITSSTPSAPDRKCAVNEPARASWPIEQQNHVARAPTVSIPPELANTEYNLDIPDVPISCRHYESKSAPTKTGEENIQHPVNPNQFAKTNVRQGKAAFLDHERATRKGPLCDHLEGFAGPVARDPAKYGTTRNSLFRIPTRPQT